MIAEPHLNLTKKGNRYSFTYHKPESILPSIKSKEDLKAALDYYAHPFIKSTSHDSTFSRRHVVEKVRPALRWFCKKYGENVPSWLEGNRHYDEIPKEEHEALFGEGPLKVREFEEFKSEAPEPAEQG